MAYCASKGLSLAAWDKNKNFIFRITVIKSKVCLSVRSTINLNYNMEPLNNNLHLPDLTSYYYIS